ncbi:MAG: UDP-N-acetylmuramoyl-L-alanyl-D-glutamate--2,6-diaminopimelate ligase [Planctomycetaceae bacterium]
MKAVQPNWTLGRLAEAVGASLRSGGETVVTGVQEDSRRCGPGDLFVAVPGTRQDGATYAADACARGAVAIAAERDPGTGLPWLSVPEARRAAGRLADLLHGDPSRRLTLVGITGTNGKTTTCQLLAQLLPEPTGTIGTLGAFYPGHAGETENTTPGPVELRRILRAMGAAGCSACSMEVSSHALDQGRVDGLTFAAGIYTNLTGDHLDYHGTMEAYEAAKARLFGMLDASAVAVLNAGDAACARIRTRARVVRFQADDVEVGPEGTSFRWRGRRIRTRLLGRHNAENAAAALEAAVALGVEETKAVDRIASARPARGRLEAVQTLPFLVLVDYAHTDDALDKALRTLREVARGRVIVVFGCGGDRDRTKRPRMGAVAARLADVILVTNDNPRSEEPEAIAREILAGMGERRALVLLDRREAIRAALELARPGDAVLVAGKGHETSQIQAGKKFPFDDADVARRLLGGIPEAAGAGANA